MPPNFNKELLDFIDVLFLKRKTIYKIVMIFKIYDIIQ